MKKAVLSVAVVGFLVAAIFHAYSQSVQPPSANPSPVDAAQAQQIFATNCSSCHGAGGLGGDRAPSLIENQDMRKLGIAEISSIIKGGTPRGMPAFPALPDQQVAQLASWLHSRNQSSLTAGPPDQMAAGEKFFFGEGGCSSCHMVHGRGGSNGPDLSSAGLQSTREDMAKLLDDPTSQMGTKRTPACPGWAFCPNLEWTVADVKLRAGGELRGFLRHEAEHNIIVQDFAGKEHMLSDKEYVSYTREAASYMPALHATADQRRDLLAYLGALSGTPLGPLSQAPAFDPKDLDAVIHPRSGEWPSYNGGPNGNRYNPLSQIDSTNVSKLQAAWVYSPGGSGLETTPVVVDGVMYITAAQQLCALDPATGLSLWCVARNAGQSMRAGGVAQLPARNGGGGAPVARPLRRSCQRHRTQSRSSRARRPRLLRD